jgi:hypothetical protein
MGLSSEFLTATPHFTYGLCACHTLADLMPLAVNMGALFTYYLPISTLHNQVNYYLT